MIYYGRFKAPNREYLIWMKKYLGGWEVKSLLLPRNIAKVRKNCKFWENDYGQSWSWPDTTLEEASTCFVDKCNKRIINGYEAKSIGMITNGLNIPLNMEQLNEMVEEAEEENSGEPAAGNPRIPDSGCTGNSDNTGDQRPGTGDSIDHGGNCGPESPQGTE